MDFNHYNNFQTPSHTSTGTLYRPIVDMHNIHNHSHAISISISDNEYLVFIHHSFAIVSSRPFRSTFNCAKWHFSYKSISKLNMFVGMKRNAGDHLQANNATLTPLDVVIHRTKKLIPCIPYGTWPNISNGHTHTHTYSARHRTHEHTRSAIDRCSMFNK